MSLFDFIFIGTLILFLFSFGGFFGVIWFPTRKKDYEKITDLINWQAGMTFFDLGSGTGDLLFFLSKKYGIRCVGIEVSPLLYLCSKIRSLFNKKVKICFGDFFRADLSGADVIYAFLHPKLLKRLDKKISQEIKKETSVIISCWPLEDREPLKVGKARDPYYLYLFKPMIK